ncbi:MULTISPECIES: hypothetical protein [Pseudoalteromonas]|uniref:hypothetical protein n=1 Tax=Pseudoalteromonas TaxID=53246 RepID=UPI00029A37BD|nr:MULTISPECIES: hypothetical protein [Pseudoalteromonas]AUJ70681.1 hypothetical protein PNC201_12045 [Pseudoalteromonas sp. NC201]MCF2825432.1 hypothetical protein [Pseudoalteromonas sp. OF5H-5]MCF2833533.1 hypothetical protein [Pseudoalteromonas sp. DL2-H6]MCF2923189.1 hypothetical protein [Pseudoalteromonas sp. DL2-H1]MCX2767181.1 hypothetical protein [Pseudoalteromonas sp. B530]
MSFLFNQMRKLIGKTWQADFGRFDAQVEFIREGDTAQLSFLLPLVLPNDNIAAFYRCVCQVCEQLNSQLESGLISSAQLILGIQGNWQQSVYQQIIADLCAKLAKSNVHVTLIKQNKANKIAMIKRAIKCAKEKQSELFGWCDGDLLLSDNIMETLIGSIYVRHNCIVGPVHVQVKNPQDFIEQRYLKLPRTKPNKYPQGCVLFKLNAVEHDFDERDISDDGYLTFANLCLDGQPMNGIQVIEAAKIYYLTDLNLKQKLIRFRRISLSHMILLHKFDKTKAKYIYHNIMFAPLFARPLKFNRQLVVKSLLYFGYLLVTFELLLRVLIDKPLKRIVWSASSGGDE